MSEFQILTKPAILYHIDFLRNTDLGREQTISALTRYLLDFEDTKAWTLLMFVRETSKTPMGKGSILNSLTKKADELLI